MTTPADDTAVEEAFEAYLAGRPVPEQAAALAVFSEAVRATATRPGRPNAALAELLATGLLTDQSSPSARTAQSAGVPPSRRAPRTRNRRRFAMLFPALLAKILSAGAVAQAATGAGIVVVAVTGAGAVGVLPDPLQNTVAAAVETVSPFELTGGEDPATEDPAVEEPVTDEPVAEEPVTGEPVGEEIEGEVPAEDAFSAEVWAAEGPDAYPSFGAWVSEGSRNGAFKGDGVRFGEVVSSYARAKGLDSEELAAEGVDLEQVTGAPTEPTTQPAPEAGAENSGTDQQIATTGRGSDRAKAGNGNAGNGNAGGNAGDAAAGSAGGNAAANGAGKGNGRN